MKQAIFFVLNEYADWEGAYLACQLNQDVNWEVKTASTDIEVDSIGGFRTIVDYPLKEIPPEYDLLVLIGGNSWSFENEFLKELLQKRLVSNRPVAAICGAVDYLAKNGLLTHYRHTGNAQYLWSNYQQYQNKTDFVGQQAVADRNLVTANGTAALEFTNLVLKMINFNTVKKINKITDFYQMGFYNYCERYGHPFA